MFYFIQHFELFKSNTLKNVSKQKTVQEFTNCIKFEIQIFLEIVSGYRNPGFTY